MCTVCGCGDARLEGRAHGGHHHEHHHGHGHSHPHHGQGHEHHAHGHACGCGHDHAGHDHGHHAHAHHRDDHAPDHAHGHSHDHAHHHHHHDLHFGQGPAGVEVPGMSQERLIEIETGILAQNDRHAMANRARLAALGAYAVNLVSSPGSGKTTLLCAAIRALGDAPVAVIEGDQQTSNDADRIRATGAPAVQVNTGKGCHLDGHMVGHAMEHLDLGPGSMLFIENVGNLVCPAAFDLGEDAKIAILAVTEGEDKPLKYPDMFTAAKLALLNKVDLAPHCDVDLDLYEANLRRVNPTIEVIRVSARTGEGLERFLGWLRSEAQAKRQAGARAAE